MAELEFGVMSRTGEGRVLAPSAAESPDTVLVPGESIIAQTGEALPDVSDGWGSDLSDSDPRHAQEQSESDAALLQDETPEPGELAPWWSCEYRRPDKPVAQYSAKELGREGERAAYKFLRDRGYEMIARNWKCPAGEADIVCKQEDVYVLVEVKTRLAPAGPYVPDIMPELAVDDRKQSRYKQMACFYMANHAEVRHVRFDIIAITMVGEGQAKLRHLSSAFTWDEA